GPAQHGDADDEQRECADNVVAHCLVLLMNGIHSTHLPVFSTSTIHGNKNLVVKATIVPTATCKGSVMTICTKCERAAFTTTVNAAPMNTQVRNSPYILPRGSTLSAKLKEHHAPMAQARRTFNGTPVRPTVMLLVMLRLTNHNIIAGHASLI